MPKELKPGEKEKRERVGNEYRKRIARLRIKQRTIAETVGITLPHFHQMLAGERPMWEHIQIIETIISEYENAEKRIKTKLYE